MASYLVLKINLSFQCKNIYLFKIFYEYHYVYQIYLYDCNIMKFFDLCTAGILILQISNKFPCIIAFTSHLYSIFRWICIQGSRSAGYNLADPNTNCLYWHTLHLFKNQQIKAQFIEKIYKTDNKHLNQVKCVLDKYS